VDVYAQQHKARQQEARKAARGQPVVGGTDVTEAAGEADALRSP
jgi:hypothetical protein